MLKDHDKISIMCTIMLVSRKLWSVYSSFQCEPSNEMGIHPDNEKLDSNHMLLICKITEKVVKKPVAVKATCHLYLSRHCFLCLYKVRQASSLFL